MNKHGDCRLIAFIGKTDYVQTAYADLKERKDVNLIGLSCFEIYRNICDRFHIKPVHFVYYLLSVYFVLRYCSSNKRTVILLHGVNYLWLFDLPFINIAKKTRDVKIVGYFWDVIDFVKYSVPDFQSRFDLVFTIDDQLADKYGCEYYPIFYSKEETELFSEACDVFFCGEDGGRLELIEKLYSVLTDKGFKCDFYCSKSIYNGKTINGIKHINQMPHPLYISHIKACKVILDIVKPGVSCCSLRFCEGVIYDKKVLTNNSSIYKQSFYNNNQFCVFEKAESIDKDFIQKELIVRKSNKYEVSPKRFVDVVYERLI